MDSEILRRLQAIDEKLDRLAKEMGDLRISYEARSKPRKKKDKPPPLTEQEIAARKTQFNQLYQEWLDGKELQVHDELEKLEIEELRRFADANNLNVTSKMSKTRMLELIAARFREKRQLHRQAAPRNGAGG